jgi:hypothetical protein
MLRLSLPAASTKIARPANTLDPPATPSALRAEPSRRSTRPSATSLPPHNERHDGKPLRQPMQRCQPATPATSRWSSPNSPDAAQLWCKSLIPTPAPPPPTNSPPMKPPNSPASPSNTRQKNGVCGTPPSPPWQPPIDPFNERCGNGSVVKRSE